MVRLVVFGTVLAGAVMAAGTPADAQRERSGSPPNALPPVPVLPTYNAPVSPNYYGQYNGQGYGGPSVRQGRVWVPPYYDRFGNYVPGYWR